MLERFLERFTDEFADIPTAADWEGSRVPDVQVARLHKLKGGACMLGAKAILQPKADPAGGPVPPVVPCPAGGP